MKHKKILFFAFLFSAICFFKITTRQPCICLGNRGWPLSYVHDYGLDIEEMCRMATCQGINLVLKIGGFNITSQYYFFPIVFIVDTLIWFTVLYLIWKVVHHLTKSNY